MIRATDVTVDVVFWILAIAMAGAAIGVVRSQNVVHAALYLVVVLAGVAAQYILLAAEFVAWVQVLIYIGAIVILFLFGIMLTRAPMRGTEASSTTTSAGRRRGRALFLFGVVTALLVDAYGGKEIKLNDELVADRPARATSRRLDLPRLPRAVRGRVDAPPRRARGRRRDRAEGLTAMALNQFLILSAFLFCTGIYGVLARKNAVLVLMSIELMLNAVNINLVAFSAFLPTQSSGQVVRVSVRHHDRRRRGRRRPRDRAADLPQPRTAPISTTSTS